MTFINNAEDVAKIAIREIDPSLEKKFAALIRFLSLFPSTASAFRGKNAPGIGSEGYIYSAASNYVKGRTPRRPEPPTTIPDEMVSFVLLHYFDVKANKLERIKKEHALSMGAENIVGNLLEQYLSTVLEAYGWIWCAGSLVKAVDFVKPVGNDWLLLQVKNRDNSENSSSSAIRVGTTIEKWHRTFSKKPGSNWGAFPDHQARPHLSEHGFREFVKTYLKNLE